MMLFPVSGQRAASNLRHPDEIKQRTESVRLLTVCYSHGARVSSPTRNLS